MVFVVFNGGHRLTHLFQYFWLFLIIHIALEKLQNVQAVALVVDEGCKQNIQAIVQ